MKKIIIAIDGYSSSGKSSFKFLIFVQFIVGVHLMRRTKGSDQNAERKNPIINTIIIYLAHFQLRLIKKRLGAIIRTAINVMR